MMLGAANRYVESQLQAKKKSAILGVDIPGVYVVAGYPVDADRENPTNEGTVFEPEAANW